MHHPKGVGTQEESVRAIKKEGDNVVHVVLVIWHSIWLVG